MGNQNRTNYFLQMIQWGTNYKFPTSSGTSNIGKQKHQNILQRAKNQQGNGNTN
jgi:hypothetical protein